MNFLEICGILWLVSVGAGGLWVGLCALTDWVKRRRALKEEIPDIAPAGTVTMRNRKVRAV